MKSPDWSELRPGNQLGIVKLAPDGAEAARYDGTVVAIFEPESWCVVQATWTDSAIDIDGLEIKTGDRLLEWFSPLCPFNAFAIYDPGGVPRGWYANVTYPAFLKSSSSGSEDIATLFWHDLYLDLIGRPDHSYVIRDKDELDEAGISSSDAALYQMILSAGEELASRFSCQEIPFLPGSLDSG